MTTEEKLNHFEESALEQAKAESLAMIDEYRASLDRIFEEHRLTKERQADLQLKTETVSLTRAKNKALSRQQIELKRQVKKKQSELKDKLFVEVKTKLEEYMDTPAYHELLTRQIQEILKYANGERVTIYIDPADVSKRAGLMAETGAPLSVSRESFMGGTRAVLADRHILIDNSFATKLKEEKAEFTFNGGGIHE
ncbi:MAG: V-type ATP synthase subunit E [Hominisplanchenecus sp.]